MIETEQTFVYNTNKRSYSEANNMLRELRRYMSTGQNVEIIYLDRNGKTSKRTLKLYAVDEQSVKAYCMSRCAPRVFKVESILAVYPVTNAKRGA